ncbi:unnamed protein product [Nesidiocoris tenuis]|uniref:NTF2 domain-containing protein n=1 Tax=Nesidiocoris tenuis TaxID=355587 RepID=A0A6H5GCZ7_9HEMI|nr:unnamed protein product [Nesidiocoris tenuis]
MLSETEKLHVMDLLQTIPPEDLLDIAKTTTSGIISAEDEEDAIRIIVQHADDVRSLLARKKITKTILFKYLHNKRVPFAAAIDKATLIDATIAYWQMGGVTGNSLSTQQNPSTNNFAYCSSTSSTGNLYDELAFKFCEWFFAKLNENVALAGNERIISNDFWLDAFAKIVIKSGVDVIEHMAQGSEEIVTLLDSVQNRHSLFFSPNLTTDGLRAKAEPHGLVVILVCGTLHLDQGQCVGVFENKLGLIKDPFASDNWKIKTLELSLHSKPGVTSQPVLPQDVLQLEQ